MLQTEEAHASLQGDVADQGEGVLSVASAGEAYRSIIRRGVKVSRGVLLMLLRNFLKAEVLAPMSFVGLLLSFLSPRPDLLATVILLEVSDLHFVCSPLPMTEERTADNEVGHLIKFLTRASPGGVDTGLFTVSALLAKARRQYRFPGAELNICTCVGCHFVIQKIPVHGWRSHDSRLPSNETGCPLLGRQGATKARVGSARHRSGVMGELLRLRDDDLPLWTVRTPTPSGPGGQHEARGVHPIPVIMLRRFLHDLL